MRNDFSDTREHILDVGESIILGKGYAAVGLSEILATAEVPKGSFYHYFKSKEQFGVDLLGRYFSDYAARIDERFQNTALPARARLMGYWRQWYDNQAACSCHQQCLAVKLSGEVSDLSDAMRETLKAGMNAVIERIARCIAAGIADGSLPMHLNPQQTAQTLYQLWLGASLLTKVRKEPSALDATMASTYALLGIAPGQTN
ncbi:TetR/AcrR family transcriptional regulator [Chitinivorax sp. PXF-14]|uniref:TetR/AcrR family transcriptional regulator n=1 Tax=Chitinivorax sp. PXF-14 TaxID=3230488 RepID=UPI003465F1F6